MSIALYTSPAQLTPGKWVIENPYIPRAICGHRGRVISVSHKTALIAPAWNSTPLASNYAGLGVRSSLAEIRFVCDTEDEALALQDASRVLQQAMDLEVQDLTDKHAAAKRSVIQRWVTP